MTGSCSHLFILSILSKAADQCPREPLDVSLSLHPRQHSGPRVSGPCDDGDQMIAREERMSTVNDRPKKLLNRLDTAWAALEESYSGVPDSGLTEPGVVGDWSVKDILAHVTTWEEEALKHLPLIVEGGRPPRYVTYGGIDAFNAQVTERKRSLSLSEVRRQLAETHARLIAFVQSAPDDQLAGETRFRRRLRLDTYSHYLIHARAIQEWREQRSAR